MNINISDSEKDFYRKIREHLAKLHTEWQDDPNGSVQHKNDEGDVVLTLSAGNWFENGTDPESYKNACAIVTRVEVFSYLFCPRGRIRTYSNLAEAWADVRTWKYEPDNDED